MAHVWGGAAAPRAHALTEKEKGLGPCRWPFLCLGPLSTCPRARSSPKFWTQLGQRRAPSSPAGVSPSSGLVSAPRAAEAEAGSAPDSSACPPPSVGP